jgi:hypothetical protein
VKQKLLRPAVLIPAFVLAMLGAGIAYAAWTQLNSGRVDANMAILDAAPVYPGASEIQRLTQQSSGEDVLPVPDEIVTSVLFSPPADATQEDVVSFYVTRLKPEWTPRTRVITGSGPDLDETAPTSYRVDFSRDDDCLSLLTYGMAEGHVGDPTFVLSAQAGDGPCPPPE